MWRGQGRVEYTRDESSRMSEGAAASSQEEKSGRLAFIDGVAEAAKQMDE